jgi:hypothetical protein
MGALSSEAGACMSNFDYQSIQGRINAFLEKEIFFIVGCPKSGTTWLQHILNGHPEIWCGGEAHLSNRLAPVLTQATNYYNEWIAHKNKTLNKTDKYPQFTAETLDYLVVTSIAVLLQGWVDKPGVRCIGEKTPDHIHSLEWFARLFPRAKFIHIMRDGRDAVVSAWFHFPSLNPDFHKQFPTLKTYVEGFAVNWVQSVQSGRHFGRMHPARYAEIKYEDLHRHPDDNIRRLLGFLGVSDDPAMVGACRAAGEFKKLSRGREPGQEQRGSHFRKGTVGDWASHLDADCLRIFYQKAGSLLSELGYER